MQTPSDAEKRLSQSPIPSLRPGPHRAQLKQHLVDQMHGLPTAVPLRRKGRYWIAAAALALTAGGGYTLWLSSQSPMRPLTMGPTSRPIIAAAARPAPTTRRMGEREDLRRKSLAQSVNEAQVIVVATPLDSAPAQPKVKGDLPENLIRYRIQRVLKGQFAQEIITVRTPTSAAEFMGHDWIIMLSPEFLAGNHAYAGTYTIKLEPQIQAAIAAH